MKGWTGAVEHRSEIIRLKAELQVRTVSTGFPSRPELCRIRGLSAAFDSGYERGWRGQAEGNTYADSKWAKRRRSYLMGYEQGKREAEAEIARLVTIAEAEVA